MEKRNFTYNEIKNLDTSILLQFEPEILDEWIDPFDSIPLKLFTVIVCYVEILATVIMLIFVAYETQGYAGHYRTAINQLLSCLYIAVR